jgi:hypothetical protein
MSTSPEVIFTADAACADTAREFVCLPSEARGPDLVGVNLRQLVVLGREQ